MNPFGIEFLINSERDVPGNVPSVYVDGQELSPRRLLAGPEFVVIPKAHVQSPRAVPLVGGSGAFGGFYDPSDIGNIDNIKEQISQFRVKGHARPIGRSQRAWKHHGQLRPIV